MNEQLTGLDHDPAAAPLALQIDGSDNVATMIADGQAGDVVELAKRPIALSADIPRGHKLAIRFIAAGTKIFKYGFPIGLATADISPGEHVHSHNLKSGLTAGGSYEYCPDLATEPAPVGDLPIFRGYQRADGRVGTRNEIWIIPSVGCVGNLAERIARQAEVRHAGRVDAVRAFKHPFGCSQLGEDLSRTSKILASLAQHPNAGGVLMLGLGCESNQLAKMLEIIPEDRRGAIRSMTAQAEADEMESALALVDELVEAASACQRTEVPLSKLVLGVKCGGSDGFSGLTANPLVGRMADRVGEAGGKVILTEIPEIFGAEQLLMNRSASEDIFRHTVNLVTGFKAYFTHHGDGLSDNPSPGNIAGGITTLEEKSLGAVQKGGHVPVVDVKLYGDQAERPGLTLLEAPGNDAISSTALTAAGATMILFTTGRGTPLGFPAPTIKIASNSALALQKPGWIDFDAGRVLANGFDEVATGLMAKICAIASGEKTAAERNGEHDIAIWKTGVTL